MHALALEKFAPHIEVHIYEGASQLYEIGAGIGMQPRIWKLMEELGLDQALLAIRGDAAEDGSREWTHCGSRDIC